MIALYILCLVLLIVSLIADRKKTCQALQAAWTLFSKALPMFLIIIVVMVITLHFVAPETIVQILNGRSDAVNILLASLIGSIAVVPGFIAFPVASILKDIGVGYGVLAALTTSLMMVGVLTFPLEKRYFGTSFALYRNLTSYGIALITSCIIGWILGGRV